METIIQKKLFSRIIINYNFEFINSTNYAWMPVNTSNFFGTINLSYLW